MQLGPRRATLTSITAIETMLGQPGDISTTARRHIDRDDPRGPEFRPSAMTAAAGRLQHSSTACRPIFAYRIVRTESPLRQSYGRSPCRIVPAAASRRSTRRLAVCLPAGPSFGPASPLVYACFDRLVRSMLASPRRLYSQTYRNYPSHPKSSRHRLFDSRSRAILTANAQRGVRQRNPPVPSRRRPWSLPHQSGTAAVAAA